MVMELSRKLYDSSPVWLQNCFVSLYGGFLHYRRYGGTHFMAYEQQLRDNEELSHDEYYHRSKLCLNTAIADAYANISYYHKQLGNINDLSFPEHLEKIPLLSRKDVRENVNMMIRRGVSRTKLIKWYTSGTTSSPLLLYFEKNTFRRIYAHWNRFRRWIDVPPGVRRATMSGRIIIDPDYTRPPFWRYNKYQNQLLLSSFHLSKDTAPLYVQALVDFNPVWCEGYVSTWYTLAKVILALGLRGKINPRAVSTTSETLTEHHRRIIEEAFGCPCYNQYGHGEMAVFISECREKKLHIHLEAGWVEVVNRRGLVPSGKFGEIVVTGFYNSAMPLIRYRTDDVGTLSKAPCLCGLPLPVMDRIEGRVLDILKACDGRMIPPTALTLLFDKAEMLGIENAQIVQKSPAEFVIRVVPLDGFTRSDENMLINTLKTMVGTKSHVSIQFESEIPRLRNGKYKFVVSEIEN